MGVTISKDAALSEFSFTTGIIGIVSFAFTLGTFLKVVWVNLSTLSEKQHTVHTYLTNLRTELLEEKANLRIMRKEIRKHQRLCRREGRQDVSGAELNEVSMRTMNDTVKALIKSFRQLEKPFLESGEAGIRDAPNHHHPRRTRSGRRRSSSVSPPYYTHAAYGSPPEKGGRGRTQVEREQFDEEAEEDAYWAQRTKYASYTLWKRMIWLQKKGDAQYLFETLSRVQIRRIALQVGGVSVLMNAHVTDMIEAHESIRRIDERVSRLARRGGPAES